MNTTKKDEALRVERALKLALEALESCEDVTADVLKAITAIREALAEQTAQQQEPVAYMNQNGVIHPVDYEWEGVGNILTPLYTSPPASKPWVGLTDEDIGRCFDAADGTMGSLIAAIEAKLLEKNA